jgi:hypothetical protein
LAYSNGHWSDFIADFLAFTEGAQTPELFRKWAAIALVAGALERRVWAPAGRYTTFANLFTLLVAPPGVGKLIIEEVQGLWRDTCEPGGKAKAFHVAPHSMSKAALVDTLAKAKRVRLPPGGNGPMTYNSLLVAAEEFGVLLPDYDKEYIGTLNRLWTNPADHEESRRHGPSREVKIENPQLNIIGGAQPSWLADVFPESVWSTGIGRRLVMVYASEGPLINIFESQEISLPERESLLRRLGQMSALYGPMKWREDAVKMLGDWHMAREPPAPTHSKLTHYLASRFQLVIKLAIVSAIARSGELVIELLDCRRAMDWLFEAEGRMPDIFRAMIGKSDTQVLEELHLFAQGVYQKSRQAPINEALLVRFLSERVPSDKVEKILAVAERASIIARIGGTQGMYKPMPRLGSGVE